ncbi:MULTISPECIES: HNH endonuclease [Elizabethkingia]|uniref:HNH endonuclease n=1 Tax=Elizabethkingia TaxID=308865 RepID=UPI000995B77B|nr:MULTISPECIES: HNH endonuclease [Elizabethkingia]AQX12516.1 hypothetical protein BBD35_09090 [Elizabethkingia meningoseptica]MBG0514055.1 HNH endonuclease [Elizabethkingia meningoseptica]MCT3642284.1 HNH endonuclease [Elizabethkingia anophelis]MCT3917503.1 HNH endonuclease [Elizabethkingia anophelis]MCT4034865.1 HNH endonuclease [Elizabethkingia anophelis]
MQKHTKVYLAFFNPHNPEWIACEICNNQAVDIHHIERQGEHGKKRKDEQDKIENLIAVCRKCHDLAHANKFTKDYLREIHQKKINMYANK